MQTAFAPSTQWKSRLRIPEKVIEPVAVMLLGFVMSGASILTACSPFGLAWAGAVPPELSIFAATGAIAGYAILLGGKGSLRYLAAIILLMGLRWAFSFASGAKIRLWSPVMAALACMVTGAALVIPGTLMDYTFVLCESLLVTTSGMLLSRAASGLKSGSPFAGIGGLCLGLALAISYMGMTGFVVGGVSVARIAAVWFIITAASFAGIGAGCIAGTAWGLACALSGQETLLAGGVASGLAAGIFSPMGRVAAAGAMACTSALGLLISGGTSLIGPHLVELAMGSALAMLTPAHWVRRAGLTNSSDLAQGELLRRAVSDRLARTRDALSDIAAITGQVSRRLETLRSEPLDKFLSRASDGVCRGCIDSPRCWQTCYSATNEGVNNAFAEARAGFIITKDDIPPQLQCRKADKLADSINRQAALYLDMQDSKRQASQLRSIACDQFEGMALLLGGIERETRLLSPMPVASLSGVTRYLEGLGALPERICCALDPMGRAVITAAIPLYKAGRIDLPKTAAELSELCGQELSLPERNDETDDAIFHWSSKAGLRVECEWVQRAAGAARLCGDSVSSIEDMQGRAVIILSDGMGVGGAAAVDSTMTTSLLGRLLKAGCSFEAGLRLVNSSLLSCGEERLCTIDAAVLDLYSGRLDMYKAGAAPSFIIRKGKVAKVESAALPAGILGGAEAKHSGVTLSEGDIIVMVSDGVTDSGAEWIPSQLLTLLDKPLKEMCESLLATAAARRFDGHEDDMTALAAVVVRD